MLAIVILGIGALVLGIFRLGQQLFSWQVGLLAALIVATRAAVPQLRRSAATWTSWRSRWWCGRGCSRRGARGAAGLCSCCSAWPGCCGRRPGSTRARTGSGCSPRATGRPGQAGAAGGGRAAALGLQRPGDHRRLPLVAARHPRPGAELERQTGHGERAEDRAATARGDPAPAGAARRVRGVRVQRCSGCGAGAALPAAVVVLNGLAFCAFGIAGLSLLGRYLFLAGAMLALFTAVACLGWMELPAGAPGRSLWRAAGACRARRHRGLLPRPAGPPAHALRTDIQNRDRISRTCARSPVTSPGRGRAPGLPSGVTCRTTARCRCSRTGRTSGRVDRPRAARRGGSRRRGGLPANAEVRSCRCSTHASRPARPARPAGYRVVSRNRSWLLYAGPTCRAGVGKWTVHPLFEIGLRACPPVSAPARLPRGAWSGTA